MLIKLRALTLKRATVVYEELGGGTGPGDWVANERQRVALGHRQNV